MHSSLQRVLTLFRSHAHRNRIFSAALLLCLTTLVLVQPALARNTYIITDGDNVVVHTSFSSDPANVLWEAGILFDDADTVTASTAGGVTNLTIDRAMRITISCGGELIEAASSGETVGHLLGREGFSTSQYQAFCDLDAQVYDGMVIRLARIDTETVTVTEVLPYESVSYVTATLSAGQTRVLTPGRDGTQKVTYHVTYHDGVEASRSVVSTELLEAPVSEVILIGQAESMPSSGPLFSAGELIEDPVAQTITTASGSVLSYTKVMQVTATAYTCEGSSDTTTATGTTARRGEIAVDPSVIPLGSRVYIVSNDGSYIYGYAVAEDTGGAIKGNIVDLYMDTYDECIQFGRRGCTLYILA